VLFDNPEYLLIDNTSTSSEWTQVSSKNHIKGVSKSDKDVTKRLPQNIKKLDTKHIFKNSVNKILLQHVFYSVDEYLFS